MSRGERVFLGLMLILTAFTSWSIASFVIRNAERMPRWSSFHPDQISRPRRPFERRALDPRVLRFIAPWLILTGLGILMSAVLFP